ncbi:MULTISPECIES: helix-turn-helix transcriptional regulator [unclassified Paenibacillus]|uniref:Helix-turn-helix transcriptional regulator n=1 Tax=Paenibacillus provencensis TaxID=441151 RepID=A0ABW3PUD4_9BACL|nr:MULTISPECIES: helix-turn-helix transcriptional regulator [unclassified Paenibacillus]MCM3129662.1 helix-turn-helix transcriptional regulator [Paenibacillus sp. MER 78]SFS54478.1 Helix-turn-helix domain-containing protein [Paenibacillus sp. 453mf]
MNVLVILCQHEEEEAEEIRSMSKKAVIHLTTDFHDAMQAAESNSYQYHVVYTAQGSFPSSWDLQQFLSLAPTLILTGGMVPADFLLSIIDTMEVENNTLEEGSTMFCKSLAYIQSHLCDQDLSLEKAASQIFVSRHYYSRMFQKHVGMGFKEYIIRKRIEKAKKLLKSGHSVTDVCYAIGYNDLTHFSKIFKRIVGVNPSIFRQKWRGSDCITEWGGAS